jgi:hypothetical protein
MLIKLKYKTMDVIMVLNPILCGLFCIMFWRPVLLKQCMLFDGSMIFCDNFSKLSGEKEILKMGQLGGEVYAVPQL